VIMTDKRKILNGRRETDGTCFLHNVTCKEIDNVRGLFKWGFGLVVVVGIAIGGLGVSVLDKMHDTLTILEGDVKVIKYRLERGYSDDRRSEKDSEDKVKFPG